MLHHRNTTDRTSGFGGRVIPTRPWTRSVLTALLLFCSAFPSWAGSTMPSDPATQTVDAGVRTAPVTTLLGEIRRRPLTANIVEYSFRVRVGPEAHDVIGLHRVVKELKSFVPIQTSQAILMAHGDIWGFDAAFLASLASTTIPDSQALPVFLAQHDIDIWGIDFRWMLA
jgi:hypothetical protein